MFASKPSCTPLVRRSVDYSTSGPRRCLSGSENANPAFNTALTAKHPIRGDAMPFQQRSSFMK
jgi:hypothetical protein